MARATILIRDPRGLVRSQPGPIYIPRASQRDAVVLRAAVGRPSSLWLAFGAFAIASAMLGAMSLPGSRQPVPSFHLASNQTTIYRAPDRFNFSERWAQLGDDGPMGPAAYEEPEYTGSLGSRSVRTVSFTKPEGGGYQLASAGEYQLASLGDAPVTRSAPSVAPSDDEPMGELQQRMLNDPANQKALAKMDEVERYLWEVYTRSPVKKDGSGDFSWKDPAAAKRMGMALPAYVIGGMDPDFREEIYQAGRAMDAAGLKWTMLSAFRDDYRQRLASGFKASARNSLHGGSARVGGYGHGRAIDVTSADGDPEDVWHWMDKHGAKYGLSRPMRGIDPAHIQPRGEWRAIAHTLKQERTKAARANSGGSKTADAKDRKGKHLASASR